MTEPQDNQIQAVVHSCRILWALKQSDGAGITELSKHLGLSKSTIHDHLDTLKTNGLAQQSGTRYQLGFGLLELGGYLRDESEFFQLARTSVDELATQTDELAALAVEADGQCVYLYLVPGGKAVTTDQHLGDRVPMHCTATGKSMLAYMPTVRVDEIVERHGLPGSTEATITDRGVLETELQTVREQGFSIDDEERMSGMRGVAAPIRLEDTGEVLGAIAITGPTSRVAGTYFREELPELIKRIARVVEINASYS